MENLVIALFFLVALLSILEAILSGLWAKVYFAHGLCVFERSLPLSSLGLDARLEGYLETRLSQEKGLRHFLARRIDQGLFGIREKILDLSLFKFRYTPVIHGALVLDSSAMSLRLRGYLNPSVILFSALWFTILGTTGLEGFNGPKDWPFLVVFLLAPIAMVGGIFLIQQAKYKRIWAILEGMDRGGHDAQ